MSIFCKLQNISTNTTRWSLKLRCMLSIVLSIHGIYIISSEIITSTFSSMYQTVLIFANSGKQIFNARLCEQTERDLSLRALITLIHHLHADYPTVIIKHIIIAETRNTFCWTRSLSNATFSFLITWHSSSSNSAAVYKLSSKSDDSSLIYRYINFQNGGYPPSWNCFTTIRDHPQSLCCWPQLPVKFHVNLIHRSEDIAIWIFRISGLKCLFGPLNVIIHHQDPQKAHPCVNPCLLSSQL